MQLNAKIGAVAAAFLLGLMVIAGMGQGAFAQAQVTTTTSASVQPSTCLSLQTNMRYGTNDAVTGGGITALQNFLATQGYFNSIYLGTGRFGSITFSAVTKFQASQGIPATGFVGPLTRAAIASISCGATVTPPSTIAARLYSVNPDSGAVGASISITGFGFTSNNTVLVDGLVAARNVPIASSIAIACTTSPLCHGGINQTIVFTMPTYLSPNCPIGSLCPMFLKEVVPGVHTLSVQNENGTSGTLTFTLTGTGSAGPLSISGLDTPASLALGQSGTWTVHVNTTVANQTLHYSVVWGDEAAMGTAIMAPQNTTVQSSATFTHAYQRSGTYTPVFTVTDDIGASVSASNTIVVTPLY